MASTAPPYNCTQDVQCPGNLICYTNISWTPDGCGCTSYYDWHLRPGQNITEDPWCVELSPMTYARVGIYGALAFGFAALAMLALVDVIRLSRIGPLRLDASLTTLLLNMMSFIFGALYSVFNLADHLDPVGAVLLLFGDGNKYQVYANGDYATFALQVLFGTWAALHVSLMWLELGWRHRSGKVSKTANVSRNSVGFRIVVVCEIGWILICIGLMGTGRMSFISVVALPILIGLGVTYARAGYELTHLLQISQASRTGHMSATVTAEGSSGAASPQGGSRVARPTSRDSKAIRSVRVTVINVSASLFLQTAFAVGFLYYHVLHDWRESYVPDMFPPGAAFLVLESFAILYTGWSIYYYCHRGVLGKIQRARDARDAKHLVSGGVTVASTQGTGATNTR